MKQTPLLGSSLLLTSIMTSVALWSPKASAFVFTLGTETCATRQQEIGALRDLNDVMKQFGGIDNLVGAYRLGGLAGQLKKIRVELTSSASDFKVRVDQDPIKQAVLCSDSADPGILHVRVIHPDTPEGAMFHIKADSGKDGSIDIAAQTSSWKFYRFVRAAAFRFLN